MEKTYITTLIGLGMLAILCLIAGVIAVYNIHKKRMLEKESKIRQIEHEKDLEIKQIEHEKDLEIFKTASIAEEKQKERIAKDLHDHIIPSLTAIIVSNDKAVKDLKRNICDVEKLEENIIAMENLVKDIRGISHDLIPATLISYGLIKALGYYIDQISNTGTSYADFENKTNFYENIPFSKTDQSSIYRICLEVLNNLYKHANYKFLKVTVDTADSALQIEFMHDGRGISNEDVRLFSESSTGLGLKSIKSRVLMLNAHIDYYTDGDMPSIILEIPFEK